MAGKCTIDIRKTLKIYVEDYFEVVDDYFKFL